MKKKVSFFYMLLILIINSYAQRTSNDFLPRVLSPSPEAAGIEKFISYPVSMYSGVPDISIPLYTIEVNGMKVPITLNYHASGFRVTDQAGWVGLGWTLFAGGAINRSVMGLPDEKAGYLNGTYPIKMTGINYEEDIQDLRNFYEHRWDAEPDIYSYSFPSLSGKFYYANRDINQPIIIPFNPIKVKSAINNYNLSFNILDDKGIEYGLGNWRENSVSSSSSAAATISWPLQQMVSTDKKDSIKFNYQDNSYGTLEEVMDYVTVVDGVSGSTSAVGEPWENRYQPSVSSYSSSASSIVSGLNIQEITFRNGKVVFELSASNRLDLSTTKALNKISVYSKDPISGIYTLIKSVKLGTSYFNQSSTNTTPFRLRLDSINFIDKNNRIVNQYKFEYRQDLPIINNYLKARDYWGYYNGKNNSSLVPRQNIIRVGSYEQSSTTEWIGSDIENGREPDPALNQVFILKKVILPTGGYNEFDYETNQYYDYNSKTTKYGGGLRVKQMRSFENSGTLSFKKTYKYGAGGNGRGNIIIPVSNFLFNTEQKEYPCYSVSEYYCRVRNYVSVPNVSVEPYDGTPVGYDEVTEYTGDETNNIGKTVYKYTFQTDAFTSLYAYNKPNVVSSHYKRGLLYEQTTYRKNFDNSYKKLRKINNVYGAFPDNSSLGAVDLVVFESTIYDDQTYCASGDPGVIMYPGYTWNSYSITTGDNKLIKTTDTTYDMFNDNNIVETTEFVYGNPIHQQITQIKGTSSKGDELITQNKYPADFTSDPVLGTVSTKMVNDNMLNYVIEQTEQKNGVPLKSIKTNYYDWHPNSLPHQIAPQTIDAKQGTNAYETRLRYYGYDSRSNPLGVFKENDVKQSYIWDYNSSLPVAECNNAFAGEIAYTSFESDGTGNWNIIPTARNATDAITGKVSYNLSNGSISKSGLSNSNTYTISYWTKNTVAYNIPGTIAGYPIQGRIANGWTYYEHKVTGQTAIIVSGTGYIDELRLYPSNAQMTSYTYEPLIGMSSQCDVNNRITYYEYDGIGRLKLIRDQDKKIIKIFDYKYQQ